MRLNSYLFAVLLAAAAASAACSNTAGNAAGNTNGNSGGPKADSVAGSDGTAATDTASGNDTAANVEVVPAPDGKAGDDAKAGPDATAGDDAKAGDDAGKPDSTVADAVPDSAGDAKAEVSADASKPDVAPPAKCGQDSDCPPGFGDCIKGYCDSASGKCLLKIVADGAACKIGGVCGGAGKCASGACDVAGPCNAAACATKPLACGDKITLDLAKMAQSNLGAYPCLGSAYGGGETVFALAADATMVAAVSLTGAPTDTAIAILLATPANGQCNPATCIKASQALTVGLPLGVTRTLAIDTKVGATGTATLQVTCTAPAYCGDGMCGNGETCTGCPGDCGACTTCGDKTCDKATENCGSCAADCGPCPPLPPECTPKDTPKCPGCACEACVCAMDSFCCKNAWDSTCVDECSTQCKGPACPEPVTWCGDGDCNGSETGKTCPADCGISSPCGDGWCYKSETCTSCPLDCGSCAGAAATPTCGNGKCDANEHCGTCPKDCGTCATDCSNPSKQSSTPTCGGCACEEAVCKGDPFCCKTAWDSLCVSECMQALGSKCPKDLCGDGVCSGSESCDSCGKDCGACVCGDGKCSPSESPKTCPSDCQYASCVGNCGKQASAPGKTSCYCDAACTNAGDCCPDKAANCP